VADEQLGVDLGIGHPGRGQARDDGVANASQRSISRGRARRIHAMECNARDREPRPP
jgi:hypothetical protein